MSFYDTHGNPITDAEAAALQWAGHVVTDQSGATVTVIISEVGIDSDGGTEITRTGGGAGLPRTTGSYGLPGFGTSTYST